MPEGEKDNLTFAERVLFVSRILDSVWNRIASVLAFATAAIYVGWLSVGDKLPYLDNLLLWLVPLLLLAMSKVIIETYTIVRETADAKTISSDECASRVMRRIKKLSTLKVTQKKPITIDILGISLKQSSIWIENELLPYIKNSNLNVEIRIVFVNHQHLKRFDLEVFDVDRVKDSKNREAWATNVIWPLVKPYQDRIRLHIETIDNLPHWHGVLIERRYLFLGRVSWFEGTERWQFGPKQITCGKNGYRQYFFDDSRGGAERIVLFRRWFSHYLYGRPPGNTLINTINSFYDRGDRIVPDE